MRLRFAILQRTSKYSVHKSTSMYFVCTNFVHKSTSMYFVCTKCTQHVVQSTSKYFEVHGVGQRSRAKCTSLQCSALKLQCSHFSSELLFHKCLMNIVRACTRTSRARQRSGKVDLNSKITFCESQPHPHFGTAS